MRAVLRLSFAALAVGLTAGTFASSAGAAGTSDKPAEGLDWTAVTVDGSDALAASSSDPLTLEPAEDTLVVLNVENKGDAPATIQNVRLSGEVLGMTFFNYTTRIDRVIAPETSTSVRFTIDLRELEGQATGLVPATLTLLDPDRQPLRTTDFAVDVRGSIRSVYGVFGLAVAASTALLFTVLILQLASNRLPPNRWNRATRFAVPGLGIGLTLTVTLSVLRLVTPSATAWVTLVLVSAGVAFVIGYFSPTPEPEEVEYEEDEEDEEGADLYAEQSVSDPRVPAQRALDSGVPLASSRRGRPASGGKHSSRWSERPRGAGWPPADS